MNQKSKILGVSKDFLNTYENAWLNHQKLPIESYNKLYCVDRDKYLALDNSTGNCWIEEFKTLKEAKDWLILDEIDYRKKYDNNFSIKIYATEVERNMGEPFNYLESFKQKEEAVTEAKKLMKREDYAYVEVIDSFNKVVFSSDGVEEDYYIASVNKNMIMNNEEDYGMEM